MNNTGDYVTSCSVFTILVSVSMISILSSISVREIRAFKHSLDHISISKTGRGCI